MAVSLCLCMSVGLAAGTGGGTRYTGEGFASRSPALGVNGMAATSHPIASSIAIDILKKGGSAIDAAIAANAMLALVEPHMCGIGGDLFAIVWDPKSNKLHGYNGSGRTPRGFTYEAMRAALGDKDRIPLFGPMSVSVPGAVDGWYALHERFGKLPMAQLLQPSIDYATAGIPLTEVDAALWADALAEFKNSDLPADLLAELFRTYQIDGEPPRVGQIFKNPDLASSYKRLAAGGRESFYQGETARQIVAAVQQGGGELQLSDISAHAGEWVTPVSVGYRGYDVYELPPNGQGIAALQILNILEGYDIAAMGIDSAEYVHTFVEAKKLAFEDRARYYVDMDFVDVPVAALVSKDYAESRRTLISPTKAAQSYAAGDLKLRDGDTIYLTTADHDGNMVSLIQSNYRGMGSGMTPGGLGFVLQDRAELFALDVNHANVLEPGKRPFHTIIPAFVMKDGKPLMSFGLMGGAMQPQGHAQIVINMIDFGMNLQEAGDAARINHIGSSQPTGSMMSDGGVVHLERGFSQETRDALEKLGHILGDSNGSFGGYQAILWDEDEGVYYGASEVRKDGQAAGY